MRPVPVPLRVEAVPGHEDAVLAEGLGNVDGAVAAQHLRGVAAAGDEGLEEVGAVEDLNLRGRDTIMQTGNAIVKKEANSHFFLQLTSLLR